MSSQSQAYEEAKRNMVKALLPILNNNQEVANRVLEQDRNRLDELTRDFPDQCLALVSFDVDRIKEFVFQTSKPLEVQGASVMVKEVEKDGKLLRSVVKKFGLFPENIIFAGGGTGLLIMRSQIAAIFAKELATRFTRRTGLGSCSVTWRAFAPHELIVGPDLPEGITSMPEGITSQLPKGIEFITSSGNQPIRFGEIMKLLADQLRQVKEEKFQVLLPPIPGWLHRCESCGRQAASKEDPLDPSRQGEKLDRICKDCKNKRKRGRDERDSLKSKGRETAISINKITGEDGCGYFAVLYADANDMGQKLFKMKSMVDYALFSQTVTKVMNEIITTLVDKYNLRGRYQSPVFGGDDLLLLLPANEVINIAKELLEKIPSRFSAEADKIGGDVAEQLKDISLSLGFVIVPAHFAIRFAVDYAEEALRSGKKGRRERIKEGNRGKEADCLDYLVIKDASPLNLSMEKLREKHLVSRGGIKLTTKPISVSRFSKMLDDLKYLRQSGVSLSQLQQIESLLWTESHKTISLNLRYQWLKTESWQRFFEQRSSNRDLIKGIEDWLSHDMLKKTLAGRESYFLDLMELYEFGSKEYD